MAKLVCIKGLNQDDEYQLAEGENYFGRGDEADFTLFDRACSRKHCLVLRNRGRVSVLDLNSRNGTRVNGRRIRREKELNYGDHVALGETVLELRPGAPGGVIEQFAGEVLDELKSAHFKDLAAAAEEEAVRKQWRHDQAAAHTVPRGLKACLKSLLSRFWRHG